MILDFTQYNMALYGALVALFVFGIFIGTWWWYGMRVTEQRARERDSAHGRALRPAHAQR